MAARSLCSASQTQRILSNSTASSTRCCSASALPPSSGCFSSSNPFSTVSSSSSLRQRSALSSSISTVSSNGRRWGQSCHMMTVTHRMASPQHGGGASGMATEAAGMQQKARGGAAASLPGALRSDAPQPSSASPATSQDQQQQQQLPSPSPPLASSATTPAAPSPSPVSVPGLPGSAAPPRFSPLHVNIEEFCRKLAPTEDEKKVKSIVIERCALNTGGGRVHAAVRYSSTSGTAAKVVFGWTYPFPLLVLRPPAAFGTALERPSRTSRTNAVSKCLAGGKGWGGWRLACSFHPSHQMPSYFLHPLGSWQLCQRAVDMAL